MLKLIKELRIKYFPLTLSVGNCIDVCILIGAILKYEHNLNIKIAHGKIMNCFHSWLVINGVHIDVSLDCTTSFNGKKFVKFIDFKNYQIEKIVNYQIKDYYSNLSFEELKVMMTNLFSNSKGENNGNEP